MNKIINDIKMMEPSITGDKLSQLSPMQLQKLFNYMTGEEQVFYANIEAEKIYLEMIK